MEPIPEPKLEGFFPSDHDISLLCSSSFLWNTDFINQLTVTNLRLTNYINY